ncbi:MAG TPA: hypothetical protein VF779_02560 [Pyrinomonadaceae bacterium]
MMFFIGSMLINMVFISASPRLYVSVSPIGRALLAGALLISSYTLVRYWRSLSGRSHKVRYTLVGLRAVSLLLLSLALSGLEVEYEGAARARVLLRSSLAASKEGVEGKAASFDEGSAAQIVAPLKARGVDVVSEKDAGDKLSNDEESFIAATLLTDGAMSSAEARREVESLSERVGGVPIYVVADSRANESASVALESVTILGRALRGVPVSVRCDVHARGMKGRESLLTVSDDAKVQASARLAWTEDDERQSVMLTVVPKVLGLIDYNAKVEAVGGDLETARLTRPFSLYVEERRLRVLFFESEPTWEAKFIRRALEQSGLFEVDYFAQVSRASTVGMSEEAREQKEQGEETKPQEEKRVAASANAPEAKLHATLQSMAQLNLYDCVMVGATENSLLSASEAANLNAWVERRGGGLIVLGGNSFNGSIVSPGGKLYSLLPADLSAQSFSTQAETVSQGHPLEAEKTRGDFLLTPTETGASGALEGYLSAVEDTQTKPAMLTGQGLKLSSLRPGATVLAVAGQPDVVTGTSETGAALIAARRDGAGRTLLFAPADSWRMRALESGEEGQTGGTFSALWQGLTIWTSAMARPPAEISLNNDSPAEGSVVTAEIRARDAISFSTQEIEKLSARLQPLTEDADDASLSPAPSQELPFAPDASDPSVWRAQFTAPSTGKYVLEIDYVAGGKAGRVEKYFAVVVPQAEERGAAFDALRRAARETTGDLIAPDGMDALAERLSKASSSRGMVSHTFELRTWWPLAFIIPLLLSAEWFARRWWREEQG